MGKVYQVLIVGIKDERKTIDVANSESEFNSMTVAVFKKKVVEKFPEIKGETFTLLYTDKPLHDDDSFSTHGIQDRSTIMLILRLPGGSDL